MKLNRLLQLVPVIAALCGACAVASAQTVYQVTNIPFTPVILGPSGQVAGVTYASNGYVVNGYYETGANGSGESSLGTNGSNVFTTLNSAPGSQATPFSTASMPANDTNCGSSCTATPRITFVGMNDSGEIAANLGWSDVYPNEVSGAVSGPNGAVYDQNNNTVTFMGLNNAIGALNNVGQVAYYGDSSTAYSNNGATQTTVGGSVSLYNLGTGANSTITDLGYGGTASAVNSTGQMTGGLYTSVLYSCTVQQGVCQQTGGSGNTRAFRTGANGVTTAVFGTANGVSSTGLAINDSGQVGGYITLASGQTEAFLTTAHGGLMVGLGAGAAGDSTEVTFLNDSGNAIIEDTNTNTWYLYDGGVIAPVANMTNGDTSAVVGFNDANQLLLADPGLYSIASTSSLSASELSQVSGAVNISSTDTYAQVAQAQGGMMPDSTFFSSPTTSTDNVPLQQATGGSGVPEPASFGLFALAALGLALLRQRSVRGADMLG